MNIIYYLKNDWNKLLILLLIISNSLFPLLLMSQTKDIEARKKAHFETQDDPYIPVDRKSQKTSKAYQFKSSQIFTTQVNINEDGMNILGDAANEPSIAIDPTNPNRMLIAWRQFDDVNNNFRQAGYAYSLDGGESWTFPGVIDGGIFRSDPVLDTDSDGTFYYNSLTSDASNNFECTVFKSDSDDFEWDNGTFAYGGDKQWMTIDKSEGMGNGHNYSFWTYYFSACDFKSFTRSTNLGDDYEDCEYVDGNPQWGTITVGKNGEVYIAGLGDSGELVFTKSLTAQDADEDVSWEGVTYIDLDGAPLLQPPLNPQGLAGQVWIDSDKSDGPGSGNIYILSSVERFSNSDPLDVMFIKSTDGGDTWSNPVRLNDDLTTYEYQWFGSLSVAPNGRIDVIWLDTRDAIGNSYHSCLYYTYSTDQGESWSVNEKVSEIFDPSLGYPNQNKMGDYFHMISDNDHAHLAWANTFNGEQDVYYSRISNDFVGMEDYNMEEQFSMKILPNPNNGLFQLSYHLNAEAESVFLVRDLFGNIIESIHLTAFNVGSHHKNIDVSHLPNGIYICQLKAKEKVISKRMVLLK